MEIKNIEKHIEVNYPSQNEITNKKIETSIPKKWIKLGITSFIFSIIFNNKIYASAPTVYYEMPSVTLSGGAAPKSPIFIYGEFACLAISIIAAITFFINLIMIAKLKLRANKEGKSSKMSKKLKISLILSINFIILSTIVRYTLAYFS